MEPDITAISSSPVTDAQGRPVADEPARAGSPGTSFTVEGHATVPRVALANGHANGHPNRHTNGHGVGLADGHASAPWSIDPLTSVPSTWPALAGPVRAKIVTGR